MARYFFDVHNTDPTCWDIEGTECADRAAIEAHAQCAANGHAAEHDGGRAAVTVSVHNDSQSIVLTATLENAGMRFDSGKPF